MPGERAEHVVEEADSRGHVGAARAVEVDLEVDLGLLGLAVQGGRAAHGRASVVSVTEVSASLNAAISGAVPMETRSQPYGPVSRISTPRSSNPCQTACLWGKCPNSAKLASLSATVKPRARNHSTVVSRSARRSSTAASSPSAWRRAASATAWVTAERW